MSNIKKIAYLMGAGATHAEITNLEDSASETFIQKNGLLISNVSKRVIVKAQTAHGFKNDVECVTSPEGSLNIELLISLFESNRIHNAENKIKILKRLVQTDILDRLSVTRKKRFYLHKAFFELHQLIEDKEDLTGIISLNYDAVLDEAYTTIYKKLPDYCHTSRCKVAQFPLLKLHGSFGWKNVIIYGRPKDISIIPLGVNKKYLSPPYSFIWSKAFEVLVECDILRLIGCALSQNDIGLIDLLFKAHIERGTAFEIQVIDYQTAGDQIKNNYGFFPDITKPKDIENALIADEQILKNDHVGNPFKIWLKAKAKRMLTEEKIAKTKYIKRCFNTHKGD